MKLVGEAFKGKKRGEDKYFLYRVNAKGEVSYMLREGRLPGSVFYATPGTTYELLRAYADTKSGVKALRRLERGFSSPGRAGRSSARRLADRRPAAPGDPAPRPASR